MANVVLNIVLKDTTTVINQNTFSVFNQFVVSSNEDNLRFIKNNGELSRNLLEFDVPYMAVNTITANSTLTDSNCYIRIDAASSNITITLPTDLNSGKVYKLYRVDASSNTISFTGTINGESNPNSNGGGVASSLSMQYGHMTIIYNGTTWDLI